MELTSRETWTLIHGLILGSLFLLAFAGGLAGLYSFRSELVTPEGIKERLLRLQIGVTGMALLAWATVITGTWVVYPWYRETLAGKSLAACDGLQAATTRVSAAGNAEESAAAAGVAVEWKACLVRHGRRLARGRHLVKAQSRRPLQPRSKCGPHP
jgi:hypothetical protein